MKSMIGLQKPLACGARGDILTTGTSSGGVGVVGNCARSVAAVSASSVRATQQASLKIGPGCITLNPWCSGDAILGGVGEAGELWRWPQRRCSTVRCQTVAPPPTQTKQVAH